MAQRPLEPDESGDYSANLPVKNPGDDSYLSDDDINLMGIVAELEADNGAYVSVYRASAGRSKGAYVFRCSPSEFSLPDILDKLRDEYGGGDFRLIVSRNGAMVKNSSINVEKPRLMPQKHEEKPNGGTDLASVLMQMQMSQQQQADNMRDLMMALSEKNSAMMLEIVRATGGNRGNQPTMADMLQMMLTVKELSPAAPTETGNPEKLLDMFFKGMEQGKELAGNGGSDDSLLQTALKTFGPSLGEITSKLGAMEAQQTQPVIRPVRRPQVLPVAVPAKAAAGVNTAVNNEEEPMLNNFLKATQAMQQFSPYINMLVNAAKQDSDVEVYANLILDQLDDDTIAEWVINPENYKKVTSYLPPEINANTDLVGWFDDLRLVVIALLNSDDGDEAIDVSGDSEHEAPISGETGSTATDNTR